MFDHQCLRDDGSRPTRSQQSGAVNNRDRNFTAAKMKRLKNVRTEMALSVLAYNLTRVMNIIGIRPLIQAMGT